MAAVNVTITGVIADLHGRTISGPVKILGELVRSDVGIGGGPMPPGEGGGDPPGIWPDPGPLPHPEHPIAPGGRPPSIWPSPGRPAHPIVIPPPQVPPEYQPPSPPPPGTVTPVPGNWPTSGMVPPEYLVVQYPGVGPVYVTAPPHVEPAPQG